MSREELTEQIEQHRRAILHHAGVIATWSHNLRTEKDFHPAYAHARIEEETSGILTHAMALGNDLYLLTQLDQKAANAERPPEND